MYNRGEAGLTGWPGGPDWAGEGGTRPQPCGDPSSSCWDPWDPGEGAECGVPGACG